MAAEIAEEQAVEEECSLGLPAPPPLLRPTTSSQPQTLSRGGLTTGDIDEEIICGPKPKDICSNNRMLLCMKSKRRKNYIPKRRTQVFVSDSNGHDTSISTEFEEDHVDSNDVDVSQEKSNDSTSPKKARYECNIAPGQGLEPMDQPIEQKLKCDQEANQIVHDANLALGGRAVKSGHLNDLITRLTSLMLQVKNLASGDLNSYGFQSLNESLQEIKNNIDPSNFTCFQNNVEVHVAHIQSGMTQMGNLHAFSETSALPF